MIDKIETQHIVLIVGGNDVRRYFIILTRILRPLFLLGKCRLGGPTSNVDFAPLGTYEERA